MPGILPTGTENCILPLTKSQFIAITAVYPSHTDAWKVTHMCLYSMPCEGCLVVDQRFLSLPKEYLRGTHRKHVVHQTKLVWLPAQIRIRIRGCRVRYGLLESPYSSLNNSNCCCSCMHSWYALWIEVPSIFSLCMKADGPHCSSTLLRSLSGMLPARLYLHWISSWTARARLKYCSCCVCWPSEKPQSLSCPSQAWVLKKRLQEESWSILHCHHIFQRLLAVTDQRKKTWLGNITIIYLTFSWQSHQDIVH